LVGLATRLDSQLAYNPCYAPRDVLLRARQLPAPSSKLMVREFRPGTLAATKNQPQYHRNISNSQPSLTRVVHYLTTTTISQTSRIPRPMEMVIARACLVLIPLYAGLMMGWLRIGLARWIQKSSRLEPCATGYKGSYGCEGC
jgi:hypothetical protein